MLVPTLGAHIKRCRAQTYRRTSTSSEYATDEAIQTLLIRFGSGGERPHKCPEEECEFACADPGSLTRHRKERHDYRPRGSSGGHPSAKKRKAARRSRRISPYTTSSSPSSSSPSDSASTVDPSSDTHRSPCPPLPELPELHVSSSPLPVDHHVGEGSKNASAAYSTELITKRAEVNDAHLAQVPHPDNAPLTSGSGLLTASEAPPVAEHPQLVVPQQRSPYADDVVSQPVSETVVGGEAFDNFYAQFDDWQPGSPSLPAPVASYNASVSSSFPSPVVSYTANNAPAPAPFPSPVASYDASVSSSFPSPVVSYTANNAPTPAPFPSPVVSYPVNTAPVAAPLPSPGVSYYAPIPTRAFLPPYETHYKVDAPAPAPLPSPVASYTGGNPPAPSPFPSPAVSYTPNNAPAPAPAPFPSPVVPYPMDNGPVPAPFPSPVVYNAPIPARGFLPPYEVHYKVDASASASLSPPVASYTSYTGGNAAVPAPLPAPVASYSLHNASVPSPFPSPVACYTPNNAPAPAPAPFPSRVAYKAPIPTRTFLPPHEVQNTVYNAPFEYHGYGYTTGATSFDALFNFSHPESFATPDFGVGAYPRTVNVDQGYQSYSYPTTNTNTNTTYAHAGTNGLGMRGLYV